RIAHTFFGTKAAALSNMQSRVNVDENMGNQEILPAGARAGSIRLANFSAVLLLALMAILAGGAARRESATIDEVAHIGAGVSYLQKLDLRLNEEHPPLAKIVAALPLALRGTKADYSGPAWVVSEQVFPAFLGEWVFGGW